MGKKELKPNAKCEYCGKLFHVKPSALRHTHYCSKACFDEAQFKGEQVPCAFCGKIVKVSPSLLREQNFCSNECRLKWLSQYVSSEINIPGHSAGHKAPHLTDLNRDRNPKLALEADAISRGDYSDHRRIMEEHLGRKLKPWEDVHHKNGVHCDNRIENLEVLPHRDHMKLHWQLAKERGVV